MRSKKTACENLGVTLINLIQMLSHPILQKTLEEIYLSESFKEMVNRHNFKTVGDILNWPVSVLLMHDGFTYHHYQELRNLLSAINAIHLLKTTPSQLV